MEAAIAAQASRRAGSGTRRGGATLRHHDENDLAQAGEDIVWVRDTTPGITDQKVLARTVAEDPTLIPFDKGFGELATGRG
jgi:hypothetical protein